MFDFYSSYPCPAVITPFRKTPLTSRGAGDPLFVSGHGRDFAATPCRQPHRFLPGDVTGGRGRAGVGRGQRPSAVIKLLRH